MNKSNILMKLAIATVGMTLSLALLEVQSAQAAALYSITDLGSFGDYPDFTVATKINDVGQVVVENFQYPKYSSDDTLLTPAKQQIFLWSNGNLKDLKAFNSLSSSGQLGFGGVVTDINNKGQMVGGWTDLNGQGHPLLGNQNTVTDLGSFNGITNFNRAEAINDLGQVVGGAITTNSQGQDQYLGWLWQNGIKTGLNSPDNPSLSLSEINNLGQIVGTSFALSQHPINDFNAVVLTPDQQVIELPALNGSSQSTGYDINNKSQVVGYSDDEAVLWSDGDVLGLGILGSNVNTGSVATGINDLGQIVGFSTISEASFPTYGRHAFLWDGQLKDLNNLIPPNSGWELEDANDINNKGQIVGRGIFNDQSHAYLLTPLSDPEPVPEPLTIMGSLTAAGFGIALRYRQKQQQKDATKA
ncbi:PEP-CTERM sorting domain-containing protein [Halotia wernerae UHCC 0503]|nr:PEP-CTERM sorting domain-containing protein [Halotia wernerae UHCC 0503]